MDAIDDLGDAIEASRNFLTPIRLWTWLKLAVVVVFVSSLGLGVGTSVPGSDFLTVTDDPTAGGWQVENADGAVPTDELAAVGLALVGLALLVWLCYAFVAGIMEFVFLESLRSNEVRVRRYFAANVGKGVRLFCFRLGLLLAVTGLGAAPAYFVTAGGGSLSDLSPGLLGLYSLYGFALYLGHSIVRRFTDEFVAPIMLLEDRGVIGAWGRFREPLTANWTEYAVYLLLAWFLSLAVLIGAWIVVGIGLFVLMIPVVLVTFILLFLAPIGILLLVLIGPLSLAAVLLFVGLVWTPITAFFQYYALLLLGDTDDDLDLVPEQRAAIRGHGGAAAVGRNDDWTGVDRGPAGRNDRRSSDEPATEDGDAWTGADPWADDADPWDDSDGDDTDPWDDSSGDDTDPWVDSDDSNAADSGSRSETGDADDADPWTDTDGTESGDPWDEPSDSDDATPWDEPSEADETDTGTETNGADDDDDDRIW